MKILKQEDISKWEYQYKCAQCNSELLVEQGDLSYTYVDGDMRDQTAGYDTYHASCPVCSQRFYIDEVNLPKILQIQVKKKSQSSGYGNYYR